MLIPPQRRFLYGDDGAATRRVGAARTTLRRRARRIAQRAASDRAARVSRRAGTNTARRSTAVSACASDCTPGASGTSGTKAVRSRGGVVSLRFDHLGYYDSSIMRRVGSNRWPTRSSRKCLWSQWIIETLVPRICAGVFQCRVSRGRVFNFLATASSWTWLTSERSIPFG
jgi:hypothetical protein